jgi:hypothetical protein
MKQLIILMISAVLLAACAPSPPRTLDAFRDAVDHKKRVIRKSVTMEIDRPFSKVFSDVKRNADKCMTLTVDSTREGLIFDDKSTYAYTAISKKTGKGNGLMALVYGGKEYTGGNYPTEDVWYLFTAEMEAVSKKKTRLTMHGTYGHDEPYRAVTAYAEGRKYRFCPPHFY